MAEMKKKKLKLWCSQKKNNRRRIEESWMNGKRNKPQRKKDSPKSLKKRYHKSRLMMLRSLMRRVNFRARRMWWLTHTPVMILMTLQCQCRTQAANWTKLRLANLQPLTVLKNQALPQNPWKKSKNQVMFTKMMTLNLYPALSNKWIKYFPYLLKNYRSRLKFKQYPNFNSCKYSLLLSLEKRIRIRWLILENIIIPWIQPPVQLLWKKCPWKDNLTTLRLSWLSNVSHSSWLRTKTKH